MDALEIAATLGGAAIGLLALVYLLHLLGAVARGVGVTLGVAVVRVAVVTALGAVSWALLGLGGVL
jgi:hypothetical protein